MQKEIFKDVVGYEGIYQVSNLGTVKSIFYRTEKILKHRHNRKNERRKDYLCVILWKDKSKKKHYIHKLVAEAFIKKPIGKELVNHIDSNTHNNRVENLEWVTHSENSIHGLICGTKSVNPHFNYKLKTSDIIDIRNSLLSPEVLALKYNVTIGFIIDVLNKKLRNNIDIELKYLEMKKRLES